MEMQLPTYDPNDFGNKPGDGPLRVGGQERSGLPSTDKDLPSVPSKCVKKQANALTICRDLWEGNEQVRERGTTYLPKARGEESDDYAVRKERSVFTNFFRRTIEGLVGLVFRRDPTLGEDVPPAIVDHWENIDLEGTHGDVFCRDVLTDALTAGHNLILVDFPATGGTQTARDEIVTGEIRPYWVPIKKDAIKSWRTTNENGRLVLTQLVIEECCMVPDGMFGEREQKQYRVFFRENGVVGCRLLMVTDDKRVVQIGEDSLYPTQEYIPIAEVTTSGKKSMFESTPPLLDIAYLNIAHYQQWSDYAYSIYKTNVPILFGAGIQEATNTDGDKQAMVIGPNTGVFTGDPQAKLEYVSHSGAALESSKNALDDLKNDIGTLGLAMLAPQKRTAETAEAKRLDKATSDSALAVAARGEQDAIEQALGFHARYLKLPSGGSIEINRDFEGLLMDAPVMTAYVALLNAGFPARPILEALRVGGRIPQDADLDELEADMMANAAAKAEEQKRANDAKAEALKEAA